MLFGAMADIDEIIGVAVFDRHIKHFTRYAGSDNVIVYRIVYLYSWLIHPFRMLFGAMANLGSLQLSI